MKKTVSVILILVMVLALAACGSGKPAASESKTLVMGTSADYPPFEFQYPNEKGDIVYGGVDISVAQYIADYTGKELKIENMGFDYLLASLQKGDFDIVIAAMEISEERLNSADFSDPYYTDSPAKILVRAEDADQYTSYGSFAGKSVGAQTATTKEAIVTDTLEGANLVSLQVVTDLVNQLVNNKVDAIVLDGGVAEQYAESNPDLVVADVEFEMAEPYRVAVAKGDPKGLLPGINEAIADMLSKDLIPEYYAAAKSVEDSAIMPEG